jgi:hypothetical protein
MSAARVLALSTLVVLVAAHGNSEESVADDPVDSVLWIHIFVQTLVWGILFPTGMVLGITRSRLHVPLQVSTHYRNQGDHNHESWPESRIRYDNPGLLPGPSAQGAVIPAVRTPAFRITLDRPNRIATLAGDLFEIAHPRANAATMGSQIARAGGESVSVSWMDTNAIRSYRFPRLLSGRRSWTMPGSLYNGDSAPRRPSRKVMIC